MIRATHSTVKFLSFALFGIACLLPGGAAGAEPTLPVPSPSNETVPCMILEKIQPQFPVRMLKEGATHGVVRVLLHVNSTGELIDTLVTAHSRRPFADEALRAIEKWKFSPGREKGTPIDTIIDLTFTFEVKEVYLVQRFGTKDVSATERFEGYDYHPRDVQSLDRLPTPLNLVEPTYPQEWVKQGIAGSVTVDFFIDETGKARFPAAAPGTHELLAGIAVAAVQQWRFIPPKAKGRPVLVRARQIFDFGGEAKN